MAPRRRPREGVAEQVTRQEAGDAPPPQQTQPLPQDAHSGIAPPPPPPQMTSSRALEIAQLTPEQLQRLAKIPICLGKVVDFSHLSGNLSWVEDTLNDMGWTKLCQISEPPVENAIRAFYVSLQVSSRNTMFGYVKGTKITISKELLVEILDCPNSGHKLSEVVPLEKQKLGIIGSLATVSKKGLLVNELTVEKRLLHSVISTIVTPRVGTHSSITSRDGNLLFWAIQRHKGTSRPSGPSSSQQQEEQVHVQETQVPEPEELVLQQQPVDEKEPESKAEQQQSMKHQSQQEILEKPPLVAVAEVEQKQQESQQESRPKRSLEDVSKPKVKTFKRKVKRRLIKDGEPVFPSPSRPTPPIPTPSVELSPEPKEPTPSHPQPTAPSAPTSSTNEIPPPSASSDPPPLASIPEDPFHQDIKFQIYPMKYQFKPSKAHIPILHTQPPHYFSSFPTATKSGKSLLHLAEILPSIQLSSSCGPKLGDNPSKLFPPFWYAFIYHSAHYMNLLKEYLSIRAFLEVHEMPGFTFEHWLLTLLRTTQISVDELRLISQKCHSLTPEEFLDLYPPEAVRYQESQSRKQFLDVQLHLNLRFYDLFGLFIRDSQAKYNRMKSFNFERFKLGFPDDKHASFTVHSERERANLLAVKTVPLLKTLERSKTEELLDNKLIKI
ncbi:hypothetical protein Taro_023545, partial [Colocasia esculenta]|nr:hypothetical protein [Colocasia esculenta]